MIRPAPQSSHKYGVYLTDDDTALLYQTVKRGKRQNSPYVVDQKPKHTGERFVDMSDDMAIAEGVRDALRAEL